MSGVAYDKLRASEFLIRGRLSSLRPAECSRRYGDAVFPHPVSEDRGLIAVMERRTAMPIRDRPLGICVSGQRADTPGQIRLPNPPRVVPVLSANGAPSALPDLPATL